MLEQLNTDMALVRELDSSNMDASRGEVSCTFTRATSSPPELQVCPFVSGAILTGAGFKANNEKWLSSFQDVLKRMLMRGYALPSSCQEPVCKLQHS